MPGFSFQKIVSSCELLSSNLKPHLTDMPHLQEESTQLDALVIETKALANEQSIVVGRYRELTRLRREAEQRSLELRSRVVAQLRGKLGFTNENLLGFGIPPRKRVRKKPEKGKVEPKPAPAEPEAPAQ